MYRTHYGIEWRRRDFGQTMAACHLAVIVNIKAYFLRLIASPGNYYHHE